MTGKARKSYFDEAETYRHLSLGRAGALDAGRSGKPYGERYKLAHNVTVAIDALAK